MRYLNNLRTCYADLQVYTARNFDDLKVRAMQLRDAG